MCLVPQVKDVSIRVIELMDHVLSTYDRAISVYTAGACALVHAHACALVHAHASWCRRLHDPVLVHMHLTVPTATPQCPYPAYRTRSDPGPPNTHGCTERFKRNGIELVLNSRVKAVGADAVTVVDKQDREFQIPFGACVWATGVAMHPLVRQLSQKLPPGTQVGAGRRRCRRPRLHLG